MHFYFPIFSLVGNANNKGVYVLSHQFTLHYAQTVFFTNRTKLM